MGILLPPPSGFKKPNRPLDPSNNASRNPLALDPTGQAPPTEILPPSNRTQGGGGMSSFKPSVPNFRGPGPIQAATSPAAMAARSNLAKPMDQMRSEAYGGEGFQGPLPSPRRPQAPAMAGPGEARPFNAPVQNQLGSMSFSNLQPRRPAAGSTPPATGPTQQSYAGLTPYVDEQIGGAPRRLSGFRGKRAGARYVEGPSKGKTQDRALLDAREKYAKLSPDAKQGYESKARMEDISSTVPGVAAPAAPMPATPEPPQRMSIEGAELAPILPNLQPKVPENAPMPKPKRKGGSYPGGRSYEEDERY